MGISIGGLASGLDSNAIIQALTSLRRRPIQLLEQRKAQVSRQQTDMSTLRDRLDKLKDVAGDLKSASAFSAFTAESADTSILTANVDGSAQGGTYSIYVEQLAQQQIDVASGISDTNTSTLGTGTFSITVNGETKAITLDSSNNTLANLVDEINDLDLGVTATIVNDGGDDPYNLVITAGDSGTDGAVTYDFTGYTAGDVDLSAGLSTQQAALDAIIEVNGIRLTRQDNLIDDAIEGVTLNLLDSHASAGETTRLTVSTNVDGIVEDIQEFVDAYNEVQSFIDGQFQYNEESGAGGSLFGDFTVVSARSRIQSTITSAVSNDNTFGSIGAIGISTQSDGTLRIDESDLRDAIESNPSGVIDLFVEGGGGLFESLESTIETYTEFDGIIDSRSDGFNDRIANINDQIDRAERRLETYETSLTRRYASLESVMGGLQAQLSFLQNSLAR